MGRRGACAHLGAYGEECEHARIARLDQGLGRPPRSCQGPPALASLPPRPVHGGPGRSTGAYCLEGPAARHRRDPEPGIIYYCYKYYTIIY